jgi:hypothetical protein
MRRMLVASLVLGMAAAGTTGAWAQEDIDSLAVKPAIANRMTPEELHAYKLRMLEAIKAGALKRRVAPGENPFTPADTCTAATHEISALPFNSSGTTIGMTDDYDLPTDVTVPTCNASTNCTVPGATAGCGPRGCIFTGTGTALDRAYRIRVSAPCDLTVTGTPTVPSWDLALVVYQAQCTNALVDCVCVDDEGFEGIAESVILNATTAFDYFLVIDGYTETGTPTPPPSSGPFNLAVTGAGCTLVPVELLDFEIS